MDKSFTRKKERKREKEKEKKREREKERKKQMSDLAKEILSNKNVFSFN